jgi:hypothetical protein
MFGALSSVAFTETNRKVEVFLGRKMSRGKSVNCQISRKDKFITIDGDLDSGSDLTLICKTNSRKMLQAGLDLEVMTLPFPVRMHTASDSVAASHFMIKNDFLHYLKQQGISEPIEILNAQTLVVGSEWP